MMSRVRSDQFIVLLIVLNYFGSLVAPRSQPVPSRFRSSSRSVWALPRNSRRCVPILLAPRLDL